MGWCKSVGNMGGLGQVFQAVRLQAVIAQMYAPSTRNVDRQARLRAAFANKAETEALVTREEAAAFLGVSTKTIQRMPAELLPRCSPAKGVVRYRPGDVLRLARRSR
jgi:purine-nucleoside phosphorylase